MLSVVCRAGLQVRCIHFRQNVPSERCWKRLGALGRELGILKRLKRQNNRHDRHDTTISEFISEIISAR